MENRNNHSISIIN